MDIFETNVDATIREPLKSPAPIFPGVPPKLPAFTPLVYPPYGAGRLLDEYVYDTFDLTLELNLFAASDFVINAIAKLQNLLKLLICYLYIANIDCAITKLVDVRIVDGYYLTLITRCIDVDTFIFVNNVFILIR